MGKDVVEFVDRYIKAPVAFETTQFTLYLDSKYQGNSGIKFMEMVYEEIKRRKRLGMNIGPFEVLLINENNSIDYGALLKWSREVIGK